MSEEEMSTDSLEDCEHPQSEDLADSSTSTDDSMEEDAEADQKNPAVEEKKREIDNEREESTDNDREKKDESDSDDSSDSESSSDDSKDDSEDENDGDSKDGDGDNEGDDRKDSESDQKDDDSERSDDSMDEDSKDEDGESKDDDAEKRDESTDGEETVMRNCEDDDMESEGGKGRHSNHSLSLFSQSLDDMLHQHGEFPAPRLFASPLRYPRTRLDAHRSCREENTPPRDGSSTSDHRTYTIKQEPLSPVSPSSVVSWKTGGGAESLWSPTTGDYSKSARIADKNTSTGSPYKGSLSSACNAVPPCSLGSRCLLPDARHSPHSAHQFKPSQSYTYSSPPLPAHFKPPPVHYQPLPALCQPPPAHCNPPKAHWQPPTSLCQPPPAHWRPPTSLWHSPIPQHKSPDYCSPKLDVKEGKGGNNGWSEGVCSPRQVMINHLVLNNTRAFHSHPLYALLHDLAVVDHYFNKTELNLAPLLSFLPSTTEEMITLYVRGNPHVALGVKDNTHSLAVDTVMLDAVAYTHRSLLEKMTFKSTQEALGMQERASHRTRRVEEICDRYKDVLRSSRSLHHSWMDYYNKGSNEAAGHKTKELHTSLDSSDLGSLSAPATSFPHTKLVPSIVQSSSTASYSPSGNSNATLTVTASSASATTTTTTNTPYLADGRRKMPNTPHSREAREVLRGWLKEHQHYPYPSDDQKAALVRLTGLTVLQVTRWLSNARRRQLPRWKAGQDRE